MSSYVLRTNGNNAAHTQIATALVLTYLQYTYCMCELFYWLIDVCYIIGMVTDTDSLSGTYGLLDDRN